MLKICVLTILVVLPVQGLRMIKYPSKPIYPVPEPTTPPTFEYPDLSNIDAINPSDIVTDPLPPCSDSNDCPVGYSCRDSNGNIKFTQEGPFGPIFGPPSATGTCGCSSRPGEVCVREADCPNTYTCYRELTGACCPPSYCVTKEYAEAKAETWRICALDPNCFFPA